MDTIRTIYVDSSHASERNGSYNYDLQGGIAVPEGARVMVDNVSFTNTFSEEVSEKEQVGVPENVQARHGAAHPRQGLQLFVERWASKTPYTGTFR